MAITKAQLGLDDIGYPVSEFLTLGRIDLNPRSWNEFFAQYELCDRHVEDLVRLAKTTALLDNKDLANQSWALQHSWRAISCLNASSATEELVVLLKFAERLWDSYGSNSRICETVADSAVREIPAILVAFGPHTLPVLSQALCIMDYTWTFLAQMSFIVEAIARRFVATRDHCVSILTEMMRFEPDKPKLSYSYAARALVQLGAPVPPDFILDPGRKKLLSPVVFDVGKLGGMSTGAPQACQ